MPARKRPQDAPPFELEDNPFKPMSLGSSPPAVTAAPAPAPVPAEEDRRAQTTMRLEDIPGIDARIPPVLRENGYGDLWPSQADAAPIAVAGENLVLAVPTASGKSLVAYLALLSRALKGAKGLYIVPLRALASEKFEDLRALGGALGLRVGIATGDLDEKDARVERYDILVATSEKADAVSRHKATWLRDIGCVVADEVHLMGDSGRGATLEVLLARFRGLNPDAQLVALSATIANSRDLARWLGAQHVKTEWRPVTLREGILYGKGVQFHDTNEIVEVKSDLEDASLALTDDSVKTGGSVIVFVNTRKATEALAEKLATTVRAHLDSATLKELKDAAAALKGGGDETTVEKRLAKCIAGGAAFHHAGLRNTERALVERLFKQGKLRALSATPTLAAGVNLPARRVVIRDLFRYEVSEGRNAPIPVLDYKQMAGRAGRPRFDKVGEAITIAKTSDQRAEIAASFLFAEPERIQSQLANEAALRTHVLASIASGFVKDERTLKEFINGTFYAFNADTWSLNERITTVIDFLLENDLILATEDSLRPTRFGKRVSELYVDPLSAVKLRKALSRVDATAQKKKLTPMSLLHAVCATPDMMNIYLRRADAWLETEAAEREEEILLPPAPGADYDFFLQELKTASLLHDWIEEADEDEMLKKYGAYPGDVANKVDSARWLLYAMEEIARIFHKEATRPVHEVAVRVEAGAKAELLPLIELRGVGRLRARRLYSAGYKSRDLLGKASASDLARVHGIGPTLAANILKELGKDPEQMPEDDAPEPVTRGQMNLGDYGG